MIDCQANYLQIEGPISDSAPSWTPYVLEPSTTLPNIPAWTPPLPAPCPTCGTCPTCGARPLPVPQPKFWYQTS